MAASYRVGDVLETVRYERVSTVADKPTDKTEDKPSDKASDNPVDYTESPDEWLAKVDAAVAAVPEPEAQFSPGMPGVATAPPDSSDDPAVREAKAMPDNLQAVLRDSLPELLPLAVRLVKLSLDGKHAHLEAALDALGFEKIAYPGDTYTVQMSDGASRDVTVRDNAYYMPEGRQRIHDALAAAV